MKIPTISPYNIYQNLVIANRKKETYNLSKDDNFLSIYETTGLNFGIANSGKLKTLFSYGVPCMYTGIEMIDPKKVQRMMKAGVFKNSSQKVLLAMSQFENMITDVEKKVYGIIKSNSESMPDANLQEILERIAPVYEKRLIKKQTAIFKELKEVAHELPSEYSYKFNILMKDTDDKLNNRPVWIPFSSFEFKYKLEKIKAEIKKCGNFKEQKVMSKMTKESDRLNPDTNFRTEDDQKSVINFLEVILKSSVLKHDERLKNLISTSKSRLNHEKIYTSFSRKAFIYDLLKLINDLSDEALKERLLSISEKLPTSRESASAYILKFSKEPSEKIAFRLLWPTFASIEHILPKSCGGADVMSNFGGATTRVNAERGNYAFTFQLKRMPDTKMNSQKYIDRLIELANDGIFDKYRIDKKYINDFKKTIQKQSKGAIVLDTSKLNR